MTEPKEHKKKEETEAVNKIDWEYRMKWHSLCNSEPELIHHLRRSEILVHVHYFSSRNQKFTLIRAESAIATAVTAAAAALQVFNVANSIEAWKIGRNLWGDSEIYNFFSFEMNY